MSAKLQLATVAFLVFQYRINSVCCRLMKLLNSESFPLASVRLAMATFIFAVLPATSRAGETAFGLAFGEPVQTLACTGQEPYPMHPREGYCLTTATMNKLSVGEVGSGGIASAIFKYGDLPFWTSNRLDLVLVEGKLAGIISRTGGRATHLSVTTDLTKRFGQPTRVIPQSAQNQLGATFDSSILMWQIGDLLVTYTPLLGDIKTGQVDFFVPVGLTLYQKLLAEKIRIPTRPL